MIVNTKKPGLGLYVLTLILGLSLSFGISTAKAADGKHEQFVQNLGEEALSALASDDMTEEKIAKEIQGWLSNYFDTPTIARFALGRYWRQASDSQKKEYVVLFKDLIVQTYSKRLEEYSGEKFKVMGHTKASDRDTIVHSKILPADDKGPTTQVDWRVRSSNGKLKIIDVIVEGVSMSVTQRSDFSSVIQKGGGRIDALLTSLRKKTENG
jgi:phospholipid transport system substrate-binding protein